MNPCARNASTLAVLLLLPVLQALCPRLAPDVISGKVIPCRYLCIKINFFELPSIILGTEKDGVLCSTLLLRRRGVCKNGGCIPFGSEDEIRPKGTFGKVILAIDKFASGSFRKKAPEPGTPFGPIVTTAPSSNGGGSGSSTAGAPETASNPLGPVAAGLLAKKMGSALKGMFSGKRSGESRSEPPDDATSSPGGGPPIVPTSGSHTPAQETNADAGTSNARAVPVDFPPIEPASDSTNPAQEPEADTGTSSARAVPVDSPPIVPASSVVGESSTVPFSGTPRGASASGTSSDSIPNFVLQPAASSGTTSAGGTPSQIPASPPAAGSRASRIPGTNPESGSSTVSEGSKNTESPGITNQESGSSSNQLQTTRGTYGFGSIASSIGSGARSATRNFFSRYRRSYTV